MNAMTEVELIARQHIAERTAHHPRLPHTTRRRRVAGKLRRVADRLDS
jgi:hypothetical protein